MLNAHSKVSPRYRCLAWSGHANRKLLGKAPGVLVGLMTNAIPQVGAVQHHCTRRLYSKLEKVMNSQSPLTRIQHLLVPLVKFAHRSTLLCRLSAVNLLQIQAPQFLPPPNMMERTITGNVFMRKTPT